MKSSKKPFVLAVASIAIVIFWVIPGVNKGNNIEYVRYYEDVDGLPTNALHGTLSPADTARPNKKVYKKEVIKPAKERKVSAKIFSRAMQFEPVIVDSLEQNAESVKNDKPKEDVVSAKRTSKN